MRFSASVSDVTPLSSGQVKYQRVGDMKCPVCSTTFQLWATGKPDPSEVEAKKKEFSKCLSETCNNHSDVIYDGPS
jgi:uncharacterized Zn finger protein (UPF0148 family)